jgi:two-component system, OmpR family, response regulator
VLRRVGERGSLTERELRHQGLVLNLDTCEVHHAGKSAALTATELGLLRALLSRPGKVFSRAELMDLAYEPGTVVSDRTIDSHMRRVRQKLASVGCDAIGTLVGLGYKLDVSA